MTFGDWFEAHHLQLAYLMIIVCGTPVSLWIWSYRRHLPWWRAISMLRRGKEIYRYKRQHMLGSGYRYVFRFRPEEVRKGDLLTEDAVYYPPKFSLERFLDGVWLPRKRWFRKFMRKTFGIKLPRYGYRRRARKRT